MHPLIIHDLAKLRMAEQLEDAERERRARLVRAASGRRPAIDFKALVSRIGVRVQGGDGAHHDRPATSGA